MNTHCLSATLTSLLFFAFGAFLIASLVFYALSDILQRKHRLFHFLIATALAISSLSYLAMGYGLGITRVHGTCAFYARFLDLSLSIPIFLVTLGFLTNTHKSELFVIAASTILAMMSQLLGVFLQTKTVSWLLFAFSLLMSFPALRALFSTYRYDAKKQSESAYATSGAITDKLRTTVLGLCVFLLGWFLLNHIFYFISIVLGKVTQNIFLQIMTPIDLVFKIFPALILLSQRDVLTHSSNLFSQKDNESAKDYGSTGETSRMSSQGAI